LARVINGNVFAALPPTLQVHGGRIEWVASPMKGVERRMLDRVGGEVARATSIVRYAPDSAFSPHTHTGGEEFLILDGVFQDEHGSFPAGTYVRNPPTSRHQPFSVPGTVMLVKLWQFRPEDRTHVVLHNVTSAPEQQGDGSDTGGSVATTQEPTATPGRDRAVRLLFKDSSETVQVEFWPADARVNIPSDGGAEAFIVSINGQNDPNHNSSNNNNNSSSSVGTIEGETGVALAESGEQLGVWSWVRSPAVGGSVLGFVTTLPCVVFVKTGHLRDPFPMGKMPA
jgi:hypothetical protein